MSVADVLNGAADLIERVGWCQGDYQIGKKHCIAGAIYAVSETMDVAWQARRVVIEVVGNTIAWNDTPGRTQDEVVAALRAAAELAS